ncbi:retinoic acid receptor responder protein 2-like [Dendropsophus ebraccatus]|uniref:retinoic acid receptor responder protein 2-like n=1 Tax=Dendropsophus ebraccatus TaxID=150705 RepID=UPI0038322BCA
MKTAAITWGILSALLVLSTEGEDITDNFSETQRKALDLTMEHFHKKDHVKSRFKVSDVLSATEIDYSSGVFVNLEFVLKQTNCRKSNWSKTDCETLKTGRTINCFSCHKFSYNSNKILSELVECVKADHVDQKRSESRKKFCKQVELKTGPEKPGSFGFLTSD